jgi:parallel beta-helix repeat protein
MLLPIRRLARHYTAVGCLVTLVGSAAAAPAPTGAPIEKGAAVANVVDSGAIGDGKADDAEAILRAIDTLPAEGGVVFFPPGNYLVRRSIPANARDRIVFRGAELSASTISSDVPGILLFNSSQPRTANEIIFEDLQLSPHGGTAITLSGKAVTGPVRISRCHVWQGYGLALDSMINVVIEECVFASPGNGKFSDITTKGKSHNITVAKNRFLYFFNGIHLEDAAETVVVRDNYFDGAWWLLAEDFSGEGSSVRYSSQGLVDEAARFEGVGAKATVRAMPLLAHGAGTYTETTLTDPSANFKNAEVRRGQIVRVGSAFGVVSAVTSTNSISVEEWLSNKDRRRVTVPTGSYAVYGIYLGTVMRVSEDQKSLTVAGWKDLNGDIAAPPNGTRYELIKLKPNYPFSSSHASRSITVDHNVFRRGWSDQIQIGGVDSTVSNNVIEDGQDMGITLERSSHNTISANRISHQGANNIIVYLGNDNTISGNLCRDGMWLSTYRPTAANIVVQGGSRNRVEKNRVERVASRRNFNGIVVYSSENGASSAADNVITDNVAVNVPETAFVARGPHTSHTVFARNQGSAATEPSADPRRTTH